MKILFRNYYLKKAYLKGEPEVNWDTLEMICIV